jgi:leader peptidase (prepilin peptidase) / N-methyltransferase
VPALWPVILGLLGLIIGSFVATLALRWPAGRSVIGGRSACDGCGRTLAPVELVPLVSALASRGRCRTCGAPISPVHWWVELACGVVGVLAGWAAPGLAGVAGAAFGWMLVALAALDFLAWWLPDAITLPLAVAGLAGGAAALDPPLADRAVGGAGGFALLWLVGWGYRRLRGRAGLGGGDPKLLGAIGCWLGWRLLPAVLVIAAALGLGAALVMRVGGRPVDRTTPLPFGALLAAAAYPAWLAMVLLAP